MGIKDLNKLLKEYSKNSVVEIPLTNLSGFSVAIDGANLLHLFYSVSWKRVVISTRIDLVEIDMESVTTGTMQMIMTFIKRLLGYKIRPIIVVDGKAPIEKEATRTKRRAAKAKSTLKYNQLREEILNISASIRTEQDLNKLTKACLQIGTPQSDDYQIFENMIELFGLPLLRAKGEGEELCAALCHQGYAIASFSTDTDSLTHGASWWIKDFSFGRVVDPNTGEDVHCVKIIKLRNVLNDLGLSFKQFVDLCILCGCDYNKNIKRVGPKTSYKLIKAHSNIDNLPVKYDRTCLIHQRCRQIFTLKSVQELTDNFDLTLNPQACATNFEQIRSLQLEEFVKGMTNSLQMVNKELITNRTTRSPYILKLNILKISKTNQTNSNDNSDETDPEPVEVENSSQIIETVKTTKTRN